MPTISFISPKGGVGKTTSTVVLATQLARRAPVTVIDADPNRPVEAWARLPGRPAAITVVSDVHQDNILDRIDEAAAATPFVLVDCEGTASLTVAYAIGASDLVIVPTQASQLDARQAGRALKLIRDQGRQARREILHRVLFTRSSAAIRTKNLAAIQAELAAAGVPAFETHLHEREAFRALFAFGVALEDMTADQVSNAAKAIENARCYAAEVVSLLKMNRTEGL